MDDTGAYSRKEKEEKTIGYSCTHASFHCDCIIMSLLLIHFSFPLFSSPKGALTIGHIHSISFLTMRLATSRPPCNSPRSIVAALPSIVLREPQCELPLSKQEGRRAMS